MRSEVNNPAYSLILHPIKIKRSCLYYYVASANLVVKINNISSYALRTNNFPRGEKLLQQNQICNLEQAYNEIAYLLRRLKKLDAVIPHCNSSNTSSAIEGIRIIPTSMCNMTCRYCAQKQNNQKMEIAVASKVINYIRNNSLAPKVHIKFYGGEPFLNFSTIEYLVEELSWHNRAKSFFSFSATTNGTIINDKIIDFLARHNFSLAISLDGPVCLHNKNRFLMNGSGSFGVVFKNIQMIREKNENYFNNYITIQPTLDPTNYSDYKMAMDFFAANGLHNISVSWLVQKKTLINKNIIHDIILRIVNRNYDNFPFIDLLKYLDILRMDREGIKLHTCGAGVKVIAISPTGELFPCEQIIDKEDYRIGDISSGVDNESLNKIWNSVLGSFENCSQCWAIRFCPYYCIAIKPFSKKLCLGYRKKIEQIIRMYIALAEHHQNCYLDFLSYIHKKPRLEDDHVLL